MNKYVIHFGKQESIVLNATDDEDVIFIVAKDNSWGIEGIPEDQSIFGAHIGKSAKKEVAEKYIKIAEKGKSSKQKKKTKGSK